MYAEGYIWFHVSQRSKHQSRCLLKETPEIALVVVTAMYCHPASIKIKMKNNFNTLNKLNYFLAPNYSLKICSVLVVVYRINY